MIEAMLLGKFALRVQGSEISLPAGKVRTLAAYLFWKQGEWVRRDFLRGMLWGDVDQERASGSLRTALHSLRQVLADVHAPDTILDVHRDAVRISATQGVYVDAFEFERQALASLQTVTGDITPLAEVLPLYRGSFFEDCSEHWCLAERRRLCDIYISVLRELVNRFYTSGLYQAAASYARMWSSEDPLDEAAYCALMRIYMAMNQRSRAIEQFETCRSVLAVELGISPSPETLSLYQELSLSTQGRRGKPLHSAGRSHRTRRTRLHFSADPSRNAALLLTYGQDKALHGESTAGVKALYKALSTYERLGTARSVAHARLAVAETLLYMPTSPQPKEALLQIERALELCKTRGATINLCRGLALKALANWEIGNYVAAKEVAKEGLELAVALHDSETEARFCTILGMALRDEFRLAEAKASFAQAINLLALLTDPLDRLKVIYERALLSLLSGDYIEAEQLLRETIAISSTLNPSPMYKQIEYAARGHLIFTLLVQCKPTDREVVLHQANADTYRPQQLANLTSILSSAHDPKVSLKDTEAWLRANLMTLPMSYIAPMIVVITEQLFSSGFVRDSLRWSAVGICFSRARGWRGWEAAFCGHRAVITAKLGRYKAASHWRNRADERADELAKQTRAWSAWAAGLIARSMGDEYLARDYLEEGMRGFGDNGNLFWANRVVADMNPR